MAGPQFVEHGRENRILRLDEALEV